MLRALVLLAAVVPVFAATAFHPVWWQIFLAAAVGSALGQLALRTGKSARIAVALVAVAVIGVTVGWSFRRGKSAAPAGNGIVVVRGRSLTWDDVTQMRTLPTVHLVVPYLQKNMQTASEDANWNTSVVGTTRDYFELMGLELATGTGFVPDAGKIVVLGGTVVKQLYAGRNPVGETIRINSQPFQIVGVYARRGTAETGQDLDDMVLMPLETYQAKIDGGIGHQVRGTILIDPEVHGETARVEEGVRELLRARHVVAPGTEDDVTIRTVDR